jgi:peptide chain release factor 1
LGARAESRQHRDQLKNKREAFTRMANTAEFQKWVKIQACKLQGKETIEDRVDKAMQPHNLLIEGIENGVWVTLR